MFWLRNKKSNFLVHTHIWGPVAVTIYDIFITWPNDVNLRSDSTEFAEEFVLKFKFYLLLIFFFRKGGGKQLRCEHLRRTRKYSENIPCLLLSQLLVKVCSRDIAGPK